MCKITLSPEEMLNLIAKSLWDYKDIARYFNINKNKAIEIKKAARVKNGGLPKYDIAKATVESIFQIQGIDIKDEVAKLKLICERDCGGMCGACA